MTERCTYCGLFAGSEYKSDFYRLNDSVFCSLPCFSESLRDAKLDNKPKVQPRKKDGKQKTKRTTRKTKTRTKRSLSAKRR